MFHFCIESWKNQQQNRNFSPYFISIHDIVLKWFFKNDKKKYHWINNQDLAQVFSIIFANLWLIRSDFTPKEF